MVTPVKSKTERQTVKLNKANCGANESGMALAVVVLTGLVLTIGAMVLSARSLNNLVGSIRFGQSKEARQIAESGMANILDELNKNYPYLLIENCEVVNNSAAQLLEAPDCSGWKEQGSNESTTGSFQQRGAVCPGVTQPASSIMNSLYVSTPGGKGKYRLMDYQFIGDAYQGGIATIKVQGQRISMNDNTPNITSSAMIEKEVTIAPKCCNSPPYSNLDQCAFGSVGAPLGLLTDGLSEVGLDVFGDVHTVSSCPPGMTGLVSTGCRDWSLCKDKLNKPKDQITPADSGGFSPTCSHVAGESSYGPRDIPKAPTWMEAGESQNPPQDWSSTEPWSFNNITGGKLVVGHDTNPKHCRTTIGADSKKTTHCRIGLMQFSGNNTLELEPEDGHINFYLDGTSPAGNMQFAGKNIVNNGNPNQFSIIAGPTVLFPGTSFERQECSSSSGKAIQLAGGGTINAFIFAPCATVQTAGSPIKINGSVISRNFSSSGNNIQINVPAGEYGSDICKRFNLDICAQSDPIREFAAIGTNKWNLIQL